MQLEKEQVRSYFLLPPGDEIYVFIQSTHLPLGSFEANSSVNKKKSTAVNVKHENPLNRKSGCFFFSSIKGNPYLFLSFSFCPCIHPFVFFLQHVNKGPANTLNQFFHLYIYKKKKSSVKARNFRQGSIHLNQVARKLLQGSKSGRRGGRFSSIPCSDIFQGEASVNRFYREVVKNPPEAITSQSLTYM